MDDIDWCSSAMQVAQTKLEAATRNLSHASVIGFQRQVAHVTARSTGLSAQIVTAQTEKAYKHTDNPYDIVIQGSGKLTMAIPNRNGEPGVSSQVTAASMHRTDDGRLVDDAGRMLVNDGKFVRVPLGAEIHEDGRINVGEKEAGRLTLRNGDSLRINVTETPNIDSIHEMVSVLEAQRTFETASKVLQAVDSVRQKASSDVGVLK